MVSDKTMKNVAMLALAPIALALAGCSDTPEESFAKAQKEFAAHDYAAARLHVLAALDGKPDDRAMLLLQVRTLLALGDGDGAQSALAKLAGGQKLQGELAELSAEAALLRNAAKAVPDILAETKSSEAERLRAMAALMLGDRTGALDHFQTAVAQPGNARAFADFARFKLMAGDLAGADALLASAEKAAPDGIDTLLVCGEVAVRHGDLKRALGCYERAVQGYPQSIAALTGKAAVLGDLGRLDEVQALLEHAGGLAPKDPSILFLRARLAADRKDWQGVRNLIQPSEAKLGAIDPLRQIYGEAFLRMGESEQAIAQLQPIVRALPDNRAAVLLLAEAQLASRSARTAMDTLRPLVDSPLVQPAELALMAKAAEAAGDPGAGSYAARSRQLQPRAVIKDLADGDIAMRSGNWAGAAASYERLLAASDGKNVLVLNNLAYAQLMLGNVAKAVDYSGQALKLAPDNASVLDTAGWARFKAGDREQAKSLLRRAAQQAPGNLTIRSHLAEAEGASR